MTPEQANYGQVGTPAQQAERLRIEAATQRHRADTAEAREAVLLKDIEALKATCAALSEEKAQEVERRLRAEEELAERRARVAKIRNGGMCAYGCESPTFVEAALAAGWDGRESTFDACLQKTWLEHVRTCPKHPQRKVEAERDNAIALKRAAYETLDGCREVVEKTIIPALEYIGGGNGKPAADLKRDALAAARKLLED